MRGAVPVLFFCLVALGPGSVRAADGDLDPSFGGGTGVVSVPYPGSRKQAGGVAVQDDGLVVVAGTAKATFSDPWVPGLARFDADGNPDGTFGTGGIVTTALTDTFFGTVALQPDGKIVVLGLAGAAVVARFTTTGAPDGGFGVAGVATAGCGVGNGDLAVQPDGKIVAAVGDCAFRFLSDGSPDPQFGTGGIATLSGWNVHALALQANGGILIAGAQSGTAAVGHLLADGTVDMGFGQGGIATEGLETYSIATDVTEQPDGKIVAVNGTWRIARFRADGAMDSSFAADGVATVTVTGDAEAYYSTHLALQGDGKILVVGMGTFSIEPPFGGTTGSVLLARLDAYGTLDASYGDAGIQMESAEVLPRAVVLQPDGRIVVVGSVDVPPFIVGWNVARHVGFSFTCPSAPAVGCKTTTAPGGASLKIRNEGAAAKKNQLQLKWKGDATMLADFGDPIGGDDYTVCLYDGGTLASHAVVAGGGTCKGKPCWKPLGTTGLGYKDSRRYAFGIGAIKLKAGAAGAAQMQVKAQGPSTAPPSLPLGSPVLVQLASETGACWEAVYSAPTKNDGVSFQAKSD